MEVHLENNSFAESRRIRKTIQVVYRWLCQCGQDTGHRSFVQFTVLSVLVEV
jgi:hypothetical protein